jgi:hypothetical protein
LGCIYKTRCYPLGVEDKAGVKPRGLICKMCDRKFLVRDVCHKWREPIVAVQESNSKMQKAVDIAEDKLEA